MTEERLKEIEKLIEIEPDCDCADCDPWKPMREVIAEVRRLRKENEIIRESSNHPFGCIPRSANHIVELRTLLREARVVLQCLESEQGREWDLRKRIDAALGEK